MPKKYLIKKTKTKRKTFKKWNKNDYEKIRGTKEEVYYGIAHHTKSRLTEDMLMENKRNKIVSKAKHLQGKTLAKKFGFKKQNSDLKNKKEYSSDDNDSEYLSSS
jgi:hypothetical protein